MKKVVLTILLAFTVSCIGNAELINTGKNQAIEKHTVLSHAVADPGGNG